MSGELPQTEPLQLFQPPGAWGLSSISPFCVKLETWLRLAGIPYVTRPADPRSAPMGKVPFVSISGVIQADSQLIIEHLTETRGIRLDEALTPRQRACAHALRMTVEGSLYFHITHARWISPDGFAAYRPVIASIMPAPVRLFGPHLVRRMVRQQLHGHGLGRFSDAERAILAAADAEMLRCALSGDGFAMGEHPCTVDASLYAMIASILRFPVDSTLKTLISRPELIDYVARMEAWLEAR